MGGGQGRARTWPSNAASGGKPCAGGPAMLRSSGSGRRGHLTSCHHRRSHRRSQHADGQQAEAKSSGQHWPTSPGLRSDRSRQLAEARIASGTWRPRRRRCQRCDIAPPCLEKSCAYYQWNHLFYHHVIHKLTLGYALHVRPDKTRSMAASGSHPHPTFISACPEVLTRHKEHTFAEPPTWPPHGVLTQLGQA